jgi:hypothetical protein
MPESVGRTVVSPSAEYQTTTDVDFCKENQMLIDDYRNAIRAKNYSKKTFEAYWPHVVEWP